MNNLKQIGLAMHNYHSTNDRFPQGHSQAADAANYGDGNYAGWTEWSALAEMLPYMEQSAIYNSANFNYCTGYGNYASFANGTASTTIINSFLCPSDNNSGNGKPGFGTGQPAINNYRGSVGTTSNIDNYGCGQPDPLGLKGTPTFNSCAKSTGAFAYWVSYGIRDFTDGTSNTVAYSECLVDGPANKPTERNHGVTGVSGATSADTYDASTYLVGSTRMPPWSRPPGVRHCLSAAPDQHLDRRRPPMGVGRRHDVPLPYDRPAQLEAVRVRLVPLLLRRLRRR